MPPRRMGQNLGNRCRLQLIWSVQDAILRSSQASIAGFPVSEVVSLVGTDAMIIRWNGPSFFYILAVPIEVGVLLWLATTQVGVVPTFISMIPLVSLLAVRLLLVRLASPQRRAARTLKNKRFGKLNEGITSNSVVKLMGTSHVILNEMCDLRKQEERKYALPLISSSLSLSMQLALPALMAWTSSESLSVVQCPF